MCVLLLVRVREFLLKFITRFKNQDEEKAREVDIKHQATASQPRNIDTDHKTDYYKNSSLCDDILIDIIRNLSMESILACKLVCRRWYSVIMSKDFAEQHLKIAANAKPITLLARFDTSIDINQCLESSLFLIDDDLGQPSKLMRVRTSQFSKSSNMKRYTLHSSCNGILLLSSYDSEKYVLFNPLREKIVTLTLPIMEGVLGIFFDKLNNEYKILLYCKDGEHTHYSTYGLKTKHQKCLATTLGLDPVSSNRVVSLPMSLCWKVEGKTSRNNKDAINKTAGGTMVFEFDTERLYVVPDPAKCETGSDCSVRDSLCVERLAWEGKLVYLQKCNLKRVGIWVLEDLVENVVWVKLQVINMLEELGRFCIYGVRNNNVEFLNIINDELLLAMWTDKRTDETSYYFCYNLCSEIMRVLVESHQTKRLRLIPHALTHIPSFIPTESLVE